MSSKNIASDETLMRLRTRLWRGGEQMGLSLSDTQLDKLLAYLQLFDKWNAAYNLSAVRKVDDMLSRHLLDSLSIVPHLADCIAEHSSSDERWLDVGSGGGLPGIPLAILFPYIPITLLDSNGKKTRFLFQVKTELQLGNVHVVQSRVEEFRPEHSNSRQASSKQASPEQANPKEEAGPEQAFTAIFSRAFANLQDFLDGCSYLVTPGGRFYAMKGQYPQDELRQVKKPFNVEHCHPLRVPGETAARHLVVVSTSESQPRQ